MHENNPFARKQVTYDEQDFDTSASSSSSKDASWEDWDEQVAADGSIRGQTISSMDEMFNFFSDLASEKIANDVGIEANFGAGEYEKKRKVRKYTKSVTASNFEQEADVEESTSASWGASSRSNAWASSRLGFNSGSTSSSRASSRVDAEPWNEADLDASGLMSWDDDGAGDEQDNYATWERDADSQDSLSSWSSGSVHTFGSASQPQASASDDFLRSQLQAYQGNSEESATHVVQDDADVETSRSSHRVRARHESVGAANRRQGAETDAEDGEVLATGTALGGGAVERFAWEQLRLLPAGNPQVTEFLSQAYLNKLPFLGVSEEVIAQQLLELEQAQTSLTFPALMQGEYQLDMAGLVNYLQEHLSVNALAYWSLSELERELVLQIVDYHDPQQYDRDNRMINYLYFVNLRLLDLLREIHTAEQQTN